METHGKPRVLLGARAGMRIYSQPVLTGASSLADASKAFATTQLEQLIDRWMPGLRVPRTFAGHLVRSDVVADLAFALTSLAKCGVREVAGHDVREGLTLLFDLIEPDEVHTFWSYRLAESLLLFGEGSDNEVLSGQSIERRRELERACDSSAYLERLDNGLAVNYAFVLARCELARLRLGLANEASLQRALDACKTALTATGHRFVDDSPGRHGRYDLYLMDSLLFAEPFSALLDPDWETSFRRAAALCRALASPSGELVPWGRSTGVLSIAATAEVAAVATVHGVGDAAAWERLGLLAIESLDPWFTDGLVNTHRRMGYDAYRGPSRWLQLSLDAIGKLAATAQMLSHGAAPSTDAACDPLFPDGSELHALSDRAAVWRYRQGSFAFTMPFVAGPDSSYLAIPHQPGTFEAPMGAELAVMTPVILHDGRQLVTSGPPAHIQHTADGVEAVWHGFKELLPAGSKAPATRIPGRRRAVFRPGHRSIDVEETLTFESVPDAIALRVADTTLRESALTLDGSDHALPVQNVDVTGVVDFRSPWGQLRTVRSVEIDASGLEQTLRWSIASQLRVAVTTRDHWYVDTIYQHLADHIAVAPEGMGWPDLAQADLFHIHWPERIAKRALSHNRHLVERLQCARVPIVWTVHNIEPHERRDGDDALYATWARAASAAIHHTRWGMKRAIDRYPFATDCVHRVIRHPHFAHLLGDDPEPRSSAEKRLGLPPCNLRIGVIGAPRRHRDLDRIVSGVLESGRHDVQLVVFSAADPAALPDDPRLVYFPQEFVTRPAFNRRLATLDAVALAYFDGDVLGTGALADAIGAGLPVLAPNWGFAEEVLDEARIPIGSSVSEIASTIAALDTNTLSRVRVGIEGVRQRDNPARIAAEHLALFNEVTAI